MSNVNSQDIDLLSNLPTSQKLRNSQDIDLLVNLPTKVANDKLRNSQDIDLLANLPSKVANSKIRNSQDMVLIIATKSQLITLTGGNFQDFEGNPLANGYLLMHPSQDGKGIVNSTPVQVYASIITRIPLDTNGSVSGTVQVYPTNTMNPTNITYIISAYSTAGQLVWGPHSQVITTAVNPFDLGNWIPS